MDAGKLLTALLDFQRFEKEPSLQSIIDETCGRYEGRELSDNEVMAGLPIYYLPIEVRIHQNKDLNFDYTVQNIVQDNILFQERMKNAKFDF